MGKIYYVCDQRKNTECSKTGCVHMGMGDCAVTAHEAYAVKDENGVPLVAMSAEEWLKQIMAKENEGKKDDREGMRQSGKNDPA